MILESQEKWLPAELRQFPLIYASEKNSNIMLAPNRSFLLEFNEKALTYDNFNHVVEILKNIIKKIVI